MKEFLKMYNNSIIEWSDLYQGYMFYNQERDVYIKISEVFKDKIVVLVPNNKCIKCEIDQDHPEIIKIYKRLKFLNKL